MRHWGFLLAHSPICPHRTSGIVGHETHRLDALPIQRWVKPIRLLRDPGDRKGMIDPSIAVVGDFEEIQDGRVDGNVGGNEVHLLLG